MAGREYRDRGIAGLASHSAAQRSECARHRRISAEQGGHVMRMLEGQAADAFVANLENRGSRFDDIEPAVSKIVDDVRRNGDAALLKYAHQFDGLDRPRSVRVCESDIQHAWKKAPAQLQTALRKAAKN